MCVVCVGDAFQRRDFDVGTREARTIAKYWEGFRREDGHPRERCDK